MSGQARLLIPVRRMRSLPGRWLVPATVTLASDQRADRLGLERTAELLRRGGPATRVVVGAGAQADVRVVRDPSVGHVEGYRLTVGPRGVQVHARADAGAFYGLATLRELLRLHGAALPACRIDDEPAFARRGVYHDCARGKVPRLGTLKDLVDRLADWKINELQLYVENAFRFTRHPAVWRGWSPLTAGQITALQAHCRARHVRLVGSLSSFGHMEKILALPGYAHLSELPRGSTLCPLDNGAIKLIAELYEEYVPLFAAEDFNVCCDETVDLGAGRSRQACRRRGVGAVYLEFLRKIHRLCRRHGKRMNAWADIVLKHPELPRRLPRDVIMLHWGYRADGPQAARTGELAEAGLAFMVCPGTGSWQSIGGRWPDARENIRQFAQAGAAHGARGLLNTDWGDYGHRQFLAVSLLPLAFGAAESWRPGRADVAAFPRTFAHAVFGDATGRLGDAIEALGSAYLRHGLRRGNSDGMYHMIGESIAGAWRPGASDRTIDRVAPESLQSVTDSLPAPATWRRPAAEPFEALALEEYAVSARLMELSCRRARASWRLGMGRSVGPAELNRLAERTDELAGELARLWRARNKPSRLVDNLRRFRLDADEARALARKTAGRET